jgi:hypothetical protein
MSRVTPDLPAGLAAALAERGATVERVEEEGARRYVSAGELFGRFTTAPADEPSFAHEVAARAVVGAALPLRAPEVVASGPGWTLEHAVPRRPPAGATPVRATIAAALAIPALTLPDAPEGAGGEGSGERWRRRARMAFGGLRPADLLAARRDPGLPLVTTHGDFHAGNVLCDADGPWVVDWELTAQRPLGYDLLSLWPTLEDPADRDLVLEAAFAQAGPAQRDGVLRLRFALLVRALAAVAGAPRGVGGVGPPERVLRELLAEARREAA